MKRSTYFLCSAVMNSSVLNEEFVCNNSNEAKKLFENKFGIPAETVNGPFFKRKKYFSAYNGEIITTGKSIVTNFYNWKVSAFFLKEPKDHAMLVFLKRLDNKEYIPKGKIVVPIEELNIK